MVTCPACHKKSKAGKTCSRCGIHFEHWLSGQISMRSHKLQSHNFLSKQNWFILILALAAIVGATKIFDFLRARGQETPTAASEPMESLDTPEKVLMEMARRANDKSASMEDLKKKLMELEMLKALSQPTATPPGKDQSWSNGLVPDADSTNVVRGRDWQGRKTFEIDNRSNKK